MEPLRVATLLVAAHLLLGNSGLMAAPGEATNLRWCPATTNCLAWDAAVPQGDYRLHRGTRASLPALLNPSQDSCTLATFSPTTTGPTVIHTPPPGEFFWYLIVAKTCAETGPAGDATAGPRIVDSSGDCFPAFCVDGLQNGSETDVDCGGSCPPCAPGLGCCVGTDCATSVCLLESCAGATCNDNVTNGNETDVDCGGGTCPPCANGQSCIVNADCLSGSCESNTCQASPNGTSCGSDAQCASGNCVDGVCCDSACEGVCEACTAAKKGNGADGTCGNISNGTDPDDECVAAPAATCGTSGTCSGSGSCALYSAGTQCVAPFCSGAISNSADVCDGAGTCVDGGTTNCSPYVCDGGTGLCNTTCANDAGCASGFYCSAGSCVLKKSNGTACLGGNECISSNCVDGVCCNTACSGLCQACTTAKKGSGANGTCGNIINGTDPDDECSLSPVATCGTNGFCSGAGTCALYSVGTQCVAPFCSGAVSNSADVCDGAGTCVDGGTTNCSPYVCNGVSGLCNVTCVVDAGCASGFYCSAGSCVLKKSNGTACLGGNQCISGNCVDGVCCDTACNGLCEACTTAKKGSGANGSCGSIANGTDPDNECAGASTCDGAGACTAAANGSPCSVSSQCASGFCVDGVCCNNSCTGLCMACSAAKKGFGADGACDNIANGTDPDDECFTSPPALCGPNGFCSGSGSCALYPAGSVCVAAFCSGSVSNNPDECDGTGTCVDNGTTNCSPYACNSGTGFCNTTCSNDTGCATGFYCSAGSCVPKKSNGLACLGANECSSGNCVDGVCCNTACTGVCQACSAAKKGSGANGTCGNIANGTDPDNECAGASTCNGAGACGP